MTLPNFLVIGTGRSGTTSLHHYLNEHPDVYLPAVKSPSHFYCQGRPARHPNAEHFSPDYFVPDPVDYEALFDGVRGQRAIGEVSPAYLATIHAAPRIADRLPGVKLVAVLRHPVDRAFARFVARSRDGLERRSSFADVVRDERQQPLIRNDAAGTYLAAGFVSHFLASYLERFPRDRIRIYLYEDFHRDPADILRDLFAFLEVDSTFCPDLSRRHNQSGGLIRSPLLRRVWVRSARPRARIRPYLPRSMRDLGFRLVTRNLAPVQLDFMLRAELGELYREEIQRLSALLDRDLSHWIHRTDEAAPLSQAASAQR